MEGSFFRKLITPVPPRPWTLNLGVGINGAFLITQAIMLSSHFIAENAATGKDCQVADYQLVLATLFFETALPVILLLRIFSGRKWAAFFYPFAILLLTFGPEMVVTDNVLTPSTKYVISAGFCTLSCLLFFVPSSLQWFKACNETFKKRPGRPVTIVAGTLSSGAFLMLQNLVALWVALISAGFASLSSESGCRMPGDIIVMISGFYDVLLIGGIPGALLLIYVWSGRNWARIGYSVFLLAICGYFYFSVRFAISDPDDGLDLPHCVSLICQVGAILSGVLFFIPPSNRWFKAHAA